MIFIRNVRRIASYLRFDIIRTLIKSDSFSSMAPADILLISGDVDRSLKVNQKQFSAIIDSIIYDFELNNISYNSIAAPWATLVGNRCYHFTYSFNRLYFFCFILARLFDFFKLLRVAFMLRRYPLERIIKTSGCKLVLGIDLSDAFCSVCAEHGIKTIEVMHTMGYCKIVRGWEEREHNKLPNAIFCYDLETKFTYSNSCKQLEIKTVNHPFLSKFESASIHKNKYQRMFGLLDSTKEYHLNNGKVSILYCLQWGYDGEIDDLNGILENGVYPSFLPDIIRNTQDTINWHFRLHPVQLLSGRYEHHLSLIHLLTRDAENVFWSDASLDPLPEVLQHMDGVLTMTSQAIYDAAYFNVKSALLCPSAQPGGRFENLGNNLKKSGLLTRLSFEQASVLDWLKIILLSDNLPKDWKQKFDCISKVVKSYL